MMNRFRKPFALIALLLLSTSCAAFQKVIWPATVTCAGAQVGDLVSQVEAILLHGGNAAELTPDEVSQLEALAASNGADLIACIIEQLINAWMKPTGSIPPTPNSDAARRGQDFLNARKVQVQYQGG